VDFDGALADRKSESDAAGLPVARIADAVEGNESACARRLFERVTAKETTPRRSAMSALRSYGTDTYN
jgi:hypothetical protein